MWGDGSAGTDEKETDTAVRSIKLERQEVRDDDSVQPDIVKHMMNVRPSGNVIETALPNDSEFDKMTPEMKDDYFNKHKYNAQERLDAERNLS